MRQMSDDDYTWYADYFTYTALSGWDSASPLARAAIYPLSVNPLTFAIYTDAIRARNTLVNELQSSYEIIFSEAVGLQYMRQAFIDLSNHIRYWTGKNTDQYLSDSGIQVFPAYASIMTALGQPIDESNVKEF